MAQEQTATEVIAAEHRLHWHHLAILPLAMVFTARDIFSIGLNGCQMGKIDRGSSVVYASACLVERRKGTEEEIVPTLRLIC